METKSKKRYSKRTHSKQAAISFLTNITLGNENESATLPKLQTNYMKETDVNIICSSPQSINREAFSLASTSLNGGLLDETSMSHDLIQRRALATHYDPFFNNKEIYSVSGLNHYRTSSSESNTSSTTEVVEHYKLTRDDSQKPIASEKIRKKSDAQQDVTSFETSMSLISVFRNYIGQPKGTQHRRQNSQPISHSYFNQRVLTSNSKHHKETLSYEHLLPQKTSNNDQMNITIEIHPTMKAPLTYDPNFIENNTVSTPNTQTPTTNCFIKSNEELNKHFHKSNPEINITLSKIRRMKMRMLSIGRSLDLEISSIAHSYAFFEKLLLKQIVTKQNRKIIAACCLFLAIKINESKGYDYQQLFDSIHQELSVSSKDIHGHEFAVFADLEFDLYIPPCEFMPHFHRIARDLEIDSIVAYLGYNDFYKMKDTSM